MSTNFFSPLSVVAVFGSRIRDPGSGINIPDPQHWFFGPTGSASRSIIQIHRSRSFYHQAKIVKKKKKKKNMDSYCFFNFFLSFYLWKMMYLQKVISKKNYFLLTTWRSLMKITGSGSASGSISQRYGCADPDPHPDLYQNFMDLQHFKMLNAKSCNAVLTNTSISFLNFFLPHLWYLGLRNWNVP